MLIEYMAKSGLRFRYCPIRFPVGLLVLASGLMHSHGAAAQIVLDGSFGGAGPLSGPHYAIGANLGRQLGGNLFHSFGQFNILAGQSATFSGPAAVTNIVSRVTGGSPSLIDGVLRSTIAGANLYFVNPSGIVFGQNAQLDVSGSFHASSAHYLKLGSEGRFDAANPGASVLKSAPPSAFGFVNAPAGPITVHNAQLRAPDGKGLSLIAGKLTATNSDLFALGGRVDLAAVASAGEVRLGAGGVTASGVTAYAPVKLDNSLLVTNSVPGLSPQGISIRGGKLTLMNGSALIADTAEAGTARGVALDLAGPLAMNGGAIVARTTGAGQGGDIVVRADGVTMNGGAFIESNTTGTGTGGDLIVDSTGPIAISGNAPFRSGLYVSTSGPGDAGSLRVNAPSLTVSEGALIHSHASVGRGADITIEAGGLALTGGGRIQSKVFGSGAGGSITVDVAGNIAISGTDPSATDPESGIVTDGVNGSTGRTGDVLIGARDVAITDGGLIATQMFDAVGGAVTMNVRRLTLASGGALASDLFTGTAGGALTIGATGSVAVNAGGEIRSFSAVSGRSGAITIETPLLEVVGGAIQNTSIATTARSNDIRIDANSVLITQGGRVNTRNSGGVGGAITVDATREIRIADPATARLETQSTSPSGTAGALILRTPLLIVSGEGFVGTQGGGGGNSGNIAVRAARIELSDNGRIDSSTLGGNGSLVDVEASESIVITVPPTLFDDLDSSMVGGIIGQSFSGGTASNIRVATPALIMNGGSITSTSAGGGNGGDIEINVARLLMSADASITATAQPGSGSGGNISIRASESIAIGPNPYNFAPAIGTEVFHDTSGDAGSIFIHTPFLTMGGRHISSESNWFGNAGNITLDGLQALKLLNGAQITTEALLADGGDIHITAQDLVYLLNSKITTEVGFGAGNGGNITIDPIFVVLDNSQIIANAFEGDGGNITIVSQFFLKDPESVVQASSRFGLQGSILVTAPNVDVTAGIAALPSGFFDASLLLRQSCAARAGAAANSFTGVGRGGLPAMPDRMGFGSYAGLAADGSAAGGNSSFMLAAAGVPAGQISCR